MAASFNEWEIQMTTYNTYQEAKISNPESNIYIQAGGFLPEKCIRPSPWTYDFRGLALCNPADHCMTVEKFLSDGCEFVEGDIVMSKSEEVVVLTGKMIANAMNTKSRSDSDNFVLRAAALEEKKPRTKVEYVRINVNDDGGKYWECAKEWAENENPNIHYEIGGSYLAVSDNKILLEEYNNRNLYRRIETPMTEREEFVEALKSVWIIDGVDGQEQLEKIVDSGLFKLVSHDSNRLKDKIRSVAEWEMNTSNNHEWESVAESIYCAVDDLLKS